MNELKEIYADNNNWLNFAELKNGALLAISLALFEVVIDIIVIPVLQIFLICMNGIVILICCISFIPFLNNNDIIKKLAVQHYSIKYSNSLDSKNIVFYINIFLSSEAQYKSAIQKATNKTNGFNLMEENYINQIRAISTISAIKYYLFSIAMNLFLVCLVVFIIVLITA